MCPRQLEPTIQSRIAITSLLIQLHNQLDYDAITIDESDDDDSEDSRLTVTTHSVLAAGLQYLQLLTTGSIASINAREYTFAELIASLRRSVALDESMTAGLDLRIIPAGGHDFSEPGDSYALVKQAVIEVITLLERGNQPLDPLVRYVRMRGALSAVFRDGEAGQAQMHCGSKHSV